MSNLTPVFGPLSHWDPLGLADLYYWKGLGDNWGHVGLMLDDGTTYVSWYPNDFDHQHPLGDFGPFAHYWNASALIIDTPENDTMEEEHPPTIVHVNGLNESAIKDWWDKFKSSHRFDSVSQNCSTTVFDALRAGGIENTMGSYGTPPIWSPDAILDYVNTYNEFRADPMSHPALLR